MGTTLASNKKIVEVLSLPKHVVPVVGFSLGYPDEQPALRDRLPMNGIIHRETYQDYTKKQIQEIYCKKEVDGMERYMSHPELRKMIEKSGVKNLAQLYTRVKYTKESHVKYSMDILACLKEQGFM